jgi:hypothetical protein
MIEYDSQASFRGQLQRGRGAAVHRMSTAPGAADAVYECVITDTRWDRQVDQRDSYLAGLIARLEPATGTDPTAPAHVRRRGRRTG